MLRESLSDQRVERLAVTFPVLAEVFFAQPFEQIDFGGGQLVRRHLRFFPLSMFHEGPRNSGGNHPLMVATESAQNAASVLAGLSARSRTSSSPRASPINARRYSFEHPAKYACASKASAAALEYFNSFADSIRKETSSAVHGFTSSVRAKTSINAPTSISVFQVTYSLNAEPNARPDGSPVKRLSGACEVPADARIVASAVCRSARNAVASAVLWTLRTASSAAAESLSVFFSGFGSALVFSFSAGLIKP